MPLLFCTSVSILLFLVYFLFAIVHSFLLSYDLFFFGIWLPFFLLNVWAFALAGRLTQERVRAHLVLVLCCLQRSNLVLGIFSVHLLPSTCLCACVYVWNCVDTSSLQLNAAVDDINRSVCSVG